MIYGNALAFWYFIFVFTLPVRRDWQTWNITLGTNRQHIRRLEKPKYGLIYAVDKEHDTRFL